MNIELLDIMNDDFSECENVDINNFKGARIDGKVICEESFALLVKSNKKGIDLYPYISNFGSQPDKLSQIYYGLINKIYISKYNKPENSAHSMSLLRTAMEQGLNVDSFINEQLNENQIDTLITAMKEHVDISDIINSAYNEPQLKLLISCKKSGFDTTIFYNSENNLYNVDKMKMMKKMVESKFDLSTIDVELFNAQQLREILKGFITGINYKIYVNHTFDYKVMRETRECIELGFDIEKKLKKVVDGTLFIGDYINYLRELKIKELNSFDYYSHELKFTLGEDFENNYDEAQILLMKKAMSKNLSLSPLIYKDYSAEQMEEILFGLEDEIDISKFNDPELSDIEMSKIRLKLTKDKEDIQKIDKIISKFTKKEKKFLSNMRKLAKENESLNERTVGLDVEGNDVLVYLYFDEKEYKLYNLDSNDIDFKDNLKQFINEVSTLTDEDLREKIEVCLIMNE